MVIKAPTAVSAANNAIKLKSRTFTFFFIFFLLKCIFSYKSINSYKLY